MNEWRMCECGVERLPPGVGACSACEMADRWAARFAAMKAERDALARAEQAERERDEARATIKAVREACGRVPELVRLAFDDGWVGHACHSGHGRVRPPPDAEFRLSEAGDRLTRWLSTLPTASTESAPRREENDDA